MIQNKDNYTREEMALLKDFSIPSFKVAKMLNRSYKAIQQKRYRMAAARRLVEELDLVRVK